MNSFNGTQGQIKLTGQALQFGATTITLETKDSNGFIANNQFQVTVTFKNHTPTISFIERQVGRPGEILGPVTFTVGDIDQTNLTTGVHQTLALSAFTDNSKLLPNNNIILGPTS
jgi:hypothetical protein